MAVGEGGFKAHGAGLGPKLGAGLASGPTGLQRRIELARARERAARRREEPPTEAEIERSQGLLGAILGGGAGAAAAKGRTTSSEIDLSCREQSGAERGTKGEGAAVKAVLPVSTGKRAAHRPREIEGEPWVALGVSRRTWERRRKKEGQ